jgi:hypothetical protein
LEVARDQRVGAIRAEEADWPLLTAGTEAQRSSAMALLPVSVLGQAGMLILVTIGYFAIALPLGMLVGRALKDAASRLDAPP